MTSMAATARAGRAPRAETKDEVGAAVRSPDPILLCAVLALVAFGVVMVYSSSAVFASERLGDPTWFLKRQLVAVGLGLPLMFFVARLELATIRRWSMAVFWAGVILLALLLLPGVGITAGGATRWMAVGPFSFQPAELIKIGLALYLAASLARKRERVRDFKAGFLGPAIVAGIPILLVLAQPDFGTALALAAVLFVMLFVAGARTSYLLGALLAAVPVAWHLVASTPYRMRRVMAFLDPWADRHDVGYQVAESLISIGSGGLLGAGLGDGRQKLFFLPEAHTDFIFSIVGEELGLLGTLTVIALFAVVIWRGLRAAFRAEEAFGAYLALGLTAIIGLQAIVNMAVTMGLLPTKGITLPFISYGGSSLLLSLVAAGLLLAVSGGKGGFLAPAPGDPR
jgi:cell division protein FtsW